MRRRSAATIVVAGAVAAVAVGSGLTAWASWTVSSVPGAGRATALSLPAMGEAEAQIVRDTPRVKWAAVKFSSGQAVGGYSVVRHAGSAQTEVCRVTAPPLRCDDTTAKPGSTVRYTVRALAGGLWRGVASPPTDDVVVPATAKPKPAAKAPDTATGKTASGTTGSEPSAAEDGTEKIESGNQVKPAATATGGPTPPTVTEPVPAPVTTTQTASPSPTVTGGVGGGGSGLE